jgi:hypothetical protein
MCSNHFKDAGLHFRDGSSSMSDEGTKAYSFGARTNYSKLPWVKALKTNMQTTNTNCPRV